MKGDLVGLTRVTAFRLAFAAFLMSLVALCVYWAGNLQELSDPALFIALDWAAGAAVAGLVLSVLSGVAALSAPLFSGRASLLTFFASVLLMLGSLAVLVLASFVRVTSGGLTF